jgi:carbonic anhydrase
VTELCRDRAAELSATEGRERNRLIELETVRYSVANLLSMPIVTSRVAAGTLGLVGAHFEIATGRLLVWDRENDRFELLT